MERPTYLIPRCVGWIILSTFLACAGAMPVIHAVETTLPPTAGSDSPSALEILQPRAGLDTRNRFYKAYPGLVYEVRLAVAGGAYPYRFSVTTGPAGLVIDGRGVISWPNPVANASSHPVTIRVQDNRGAEQSVSWSILVTTDKFLFVDPVNGQVGAAGTIADPMKGFADVYGGTTYAAKYATTNQDAFVYFKGGATYLPDGYNPDQAVQWTNRQPVVWLPYPGSHPVIDMSTAAFRFNDTQINNLYVEGFEVSRLDTSAPSEKRMAFRIGSAGSNITFRKNTIHGIAATSGSYNQSAIMISADAHGENWAFQDNRFYDIHHAYGILGYTAYKVLVEDNIFTDMTDSHQIGPKSGTKSWYIRHNEITGCSGWGIWIPGGTSHGPYANMDISYNRVEMTSGFALHINQRVDGKMGTVEAYRNTLKGDIEISDVIPTIGPIKIHNNVIINALSGGIVTHPSPAPSSAYDASDNLIGTAGAGIIDAQALLTSSYQTYLGTRGWQTMTDTIGLVLSATAVSVPEGGIATVQVKLSASPATTTTVAVSRTAGDADLSIGAGSILTFTTTNWNTSQTVTLAAAPDADTTNGVATITVASAGLTNQTITATEADDDGDPSGDLSGEGGGGGDGGDGGDGCGIGSVLSVLTAMACMAMFRRLR